jgi:hypothetical protein
MENQQLVPPTRQCSSTPVGLGQGFLSKEQHDNTAASPYSPALPPADFYLFSRLKSALKGQCFFGATDNITSATENIKISFQECFQTFRVAGRSV